MSGRRILGFLIARPVIAIVIAAVVVGVLLLLQTHKETTPVTHRTEHVALSDAQQTQLGSQQYAKTCRKPGGHRLVGADYAQVQRVASGSRRRRPRQARVRLEGDAASQERGERLLPAGRQDRRLHRHPPVTGNDAALATVLGHEVAHATAEHAAERIEREHLTKVAAAIVAGGVAFTPRQYLRVVALLGAAGSLPFSRSQESEADHIGLVYMAQGGYQPRQAVAFWKRMQRASKGKEPPEFSERSPERRAPQRANPGVAAGGSAGIRAFDQLRGDVADRVDPDRGEFERVGAGWIVRVRNRDDGHSRGRRGADAVGRVLGRYAARGVGLERAGDRQVDVGRGLAALDLLG
jgi:hypothetical protein